MTATTSDGLMPVTAAAPSDNQRLFMRYFTAILIDLTVLNLFDEYWDAVTISSFTVSLMAAIVLQVLLKATIAVEHWVAGFFKGKPGKLMIFLRFFFAWLVLFGSKFVILEALSTIFGKNVHFTGILHGIIPLIIVLLVMLAVEELVVRIYRRLSPSRAA